MSIRGGPEIVTARVPISAFWSIPKLSDEVVAKPFDRMIQRNGAIEKGSVAVGPNVQVVQHESQADDQPLAQILDMRAARTDPEAIVDLPQPQCLEA